MTLSTTPLGRTPFEVTRLGLGAWAIGGGNWQGGWGPQDDDDSIRTIHHAVDRGLNWIDTAPAYGLGHAEEVVGRAVAQLPEGRRPYVFTKLGLVWEPGGTTVSNVLAPASIRWECEDSLRRLGVECIDLLQVHWPSADGTPVEESWATMAALVEEGKARAIGVSNFGVDLLERCEAVHPVATVQPELNMIERTAGEELLPWSAAHEAGVIVYSPMRSGLLTGRFSAERAAGLPEDDWRRENADFREPDLRRNLELVERLHPVAEEAGCSLPELAVAWALAWPEVTGAIVGARRPEQLDGWVGASGVRLTELQLDAIAAALEATGAGRGPVRPRTVASGAAA